MVEGPGTTAADGLLAAAVRHVERYLATVEAGPTWTARVLSPADRERLAVPAAPHSVDEVLGTVADLVDGSGVATTSPRYLGYIPAGGLVTSAVADLLAGVSNRYVALADLAPGAAGVESAVLGWMAGVLGLPPSASGTLTSGGSLATLTALVAAREATGLDVADASRWVIYVGEHTHHCVAKALRVAGLARLVRRVIPSDPRLRMQPGALAAAIVRDRRAGLAPWLVVATAGTTSAGTVDPLADLAQVADREGLWFHVDGAYGGLFALCEEGRRVLGGIERADTVVVDPHKTLFLPYGTGAVLARSADTLRDAFSATADYLGERDEGGLESASELDLELTRPFRGLRVWLPLQLAGARAFADALSEKIALARRAHAELAASPGFEVGPSPDLAIVTYRLRAGRSRAGGPDGAEAAHAADDALNTELLRRLQSGGRIYVTGTRLGGRVVLRLAVGSFRTHREHLDEALDVIRSTAGHLVGR